jgi:hypothetical protein
MPRRKMSRADRNPWLAKMAYSVCNGPGELIIFFAARDGVIAMNYFFGSN